MSRFTNDLELLKDVRFFYNGVRVNGERKIQKVHYTWRGCGEIGIYIDYLQNCAADLLVSYKDMGLNPIQKDNPLYPYIYNAALQSNIHGDKREINWFKKRITKLSEYAKRPISMKGSIESYSLIRQYEQKIKAFELRIEKYESEIIKDIKNPDEKVLEAYRSYVKGKYQEFMEEQERKEGEKQEQIWKVYKRKEGHKKYAEKLNELYPIQENGYCVEFEFSESLAIDEGMKMSLKAADKYLGFLDEEQNTNRDNGEEGWGWYDKTYFEIINEKGKVEFSDRFDIGDGDTYKGNYGLVARIMNFAERVRLYPDSSYNLKDVEGLAERLYAICYGKEAEPLGDAVALY